MWYALVLIEHSLCMVSEIALTSFLKLIGRIPRVETNKHINLALGVSFLYDCQASVHDRLKNAYFYKAWISSLTVTINYSY
uniref:Uncharacterized protein n=1 Tax=Arundo donax TaxID=35708 RepID=A0A0A9DM77_ARUDO